MVAWYAEVAPPERSGWPDRQGTKRERCVECVTVAGCHLPVITRARQGEPRVAGAFLAGVVHLARW
jgi:hypothetical protein